MSEIDTQNTTPDTSFSLYWLISDSWLVGEKKYLTYNKKHGSARWSSHVPSDVYAY